MTAAFSSPHKHSPFVGGRGIRALARPINVHLTGSRDDRWGGGSGHRLGLRRRGGPGACGRAFQRHWSPQPVAGMNYYNYRNYDNYY